MKVKQQLERLCTELHEKELLNGAICAAEQGEILFQAAFGYGDLESKRKLTLESVFELASLSKPITATAVMLLEEQGHLAYDDLIDRWFPGFPYPGITVRHLLTHTSGLPDYMELFQKHWDRNQIAVNEDVLRLLTEYQPERKFLPNEQWEYSNTGYVLLALLIERISGLSYAEYLDAHLFRPLGMLHTRVYNRRHSNEKIQDYAYGYVYDAMTDQYVLPDQLTETEYVVYLDGIQGDGTVNSTLGDLLRFDQALYTEKLVSKQSLEQAFTPVRLNNGKTFDYGFGWILEKHGSRGTIVSHSGGWPGYATLMMRYLDAGKTLIYLSNKEQDYEFEQSFLEAVQQIVFDEPYEMPKTPAMRKAVQVDPAIFERYAGSYRLSEGMHARVSTEQNRLFLQVDGGMRLELSPLSETRFFIRVLSVEVEFETDSSHKAPRMTIYEGEKESSAIRVE